MLRYVLVLFLLASLTKVEAQSISKCQIYVLDLESNKAIDDAHIFYSDYIAVTDLNGVAALELANESSESSCTISHLSYSSYCGDWTCGDTIYLQKSVMQFPEISVVSRLSSRDLRLFYSEFKKSLRLLERVSGSGVAENSVYHLNRISEYKSFLFNYDQRHTKLENVDCINSFQHVRDDTIRYFENVHRLIDQINISPSKSDSDSWLNSFFHESKKWQFIKRIDLGKSNSIYLFNRYDEEISIEFYHGQLRSIEFLNPIKLLPLVEKNNRVAKEVSAMLRLTFDVNARGNLFLSRMEGMIDIEKGFLATQFRMSFKPGRSFRESYISARENMRNEYIPYLLLDIGQPIVALDSIELENKTAVKEYLLHTIPLDAQKLLSGFGLKSLEHSAILDSNLVFGPIIYLHRNGAAYIEDYFALEPLASLFAVIFENQLTHRIEVKLFIDPQGTRLLQFYDSEYNIEWKKRQIASIESIAIRLRQYLDNIEIMNLSESEVNKPEWEAVKTEIEGMIQGYLRSSLEERFSDFKSSLYQSVRLETRF